MRPVVMGVVACMGLLAPPSATAQAVCGSSVDDRLRIRLQPSVLDYGVVSSADLDLGQILLGRMRVRVWPRGRSSRGWILCLQADASVFGPGGKSVSDVEWQIAGSPGWQPLSTGGQQVIRGTGNQRIDVMFRVAVRWEDSPGDYSAPLTFLASGQ